jgi:ATP-binding cassette subfamily B protein
LNSPNPPLPAAGAHARLQPSTRGLQPLVALGGFLRPYRLRIALALVALGVAASATLVLPYAVRLVIDRGFTTATSNDHIGRYFGGLLVVVMFIGTASALRFYVVSWLGERVVADVRKRVHEHILSLSPAFFEHTRVGEVLSRLTTDTTLVQGIVGSSASFALRSVVMGLGALVMMAVTSLKLTALAFVGVPLTLVPIILMGRRVRGASRAAQDRIAEATALAGETLGAMSTVQAYTHEDADREHYSAATELSFATSLARTRTRAWMIALAFILVGASIVGVLWIGATDVMAGRMSAGRLSQFVIYAVLLASSAGALSELWGELQRAAGATERLLEILATESAIRAPAQPRPPVQPVRAALEFAHVDFRYPSRPDHAALSDFSLRIAPGEAVALVGPSGAGKSTLFQLLLRFYDVSAGAVRFDGVDVRELDPRALRAQIAVVSQDPVIFAGSIADNIRYGRPAAGDAEVRAAAAAAAADEFIERLPQRYDTLLGERGITLSGGQRQRIAIARAILRSAPLLLLDEATSALDAENEQLVQQGLANLMAGSERQGRTTLVIAHRLATIQKLRRIVVLDRGRLVAEGDHAALVQRGGLYGRLAALQFNESGLLLEAPETLT